MRLLTRTLPVFLLAATALLASAQAQGPVTVQAAVDRIVQQEARTAQLLRSYSPRIETYIQEERPDATFGSVPVKDHYYLGQVDFHGTLGERSFTASPGFWHQFRAGLSRDFANGVVFDQSGFVAM